MRESKKRIINGSRLILLGFILSSGVQLNAQATVPGLKVQLVSLTNASFALHDGNLFPSFNPAYLAMNKESRVHFISFYRRFDIKLAFDDFKIGIYGLYNEVAYSRNGSSFAAGIHKQNHFYDREVITMEHPDGTGEIRRFNFSSTEGYFAYTYSRELLSILTTGVRISIYHTDISDESFGDLKKYPEKNNALSFDAGLALHLSRQLYLGLYASGLNIGNVDYLIYDKNYGTKIIRGPPLTVDFDLQYRFNSKLDLYSRFGNIFLNDLKEPDAYLVREPYSGERDGWIFYRVFDGYKTYPATISFFGTASYKITGSFTLFTAAFRSYVNESFGSRIPMEAVELEPWNRFGFGGELTRGKLTVSAIWVLDRLRREIDSYLWWEFDQSFPPIGLSIGWQL